MSTSASTTRTGCFPGPGASLTGAPVAALEPAVHVPQCPQARRTAHHAWPPGPASDLDRINRGDARSPGVLAGAQAFGLELIEVRRLPPRDQPQESSP